MRARADISRSWMLLSARRTDLFDSSLECDADQIVLDLEDAIDPRHKSSARADVVRWLSTPGRSAWVRINERGSSYWAEDIDALRGLPGLSGVMLAKSEAPEQIEQTRERFGDSTPIVALVESALGIESVAAIARSRGAFRLAFGSGDYRRDTNTSADDLAMSYPRSRLVIASRIGGLPGPIDGPTVGGGYAPLRSQSETAVSLGMMGKLCLHTDQLEVVNEEFSPTRADVRWAKDFLAEFDKRGREIRDGSDMPRLKRAEKIQGLAKAFAIDGA